MQKVTGTGCSLSAITGAFCAVMDDHFLAAICSHTILSIAAEIAIKDGQVPGTFQIRLLDALYSITEKHINDLMKVKLFK